MSEKYGNFGIYYSFNLLRQLLLKLRKTESEIGDGSGQSWMTAISA